MNKINNMVRLYNFEKKSYHMIPANEITSEMIEVKIQGDNETSWVYKSQLKTSAKIFNPELNDEAKQLIHQIKLYIDDVYYLSQDEWEESFRKDRNPITQIKGWIKVGRMYHDMSSKDMYTEEQKSDLLNIILGCSAGKNAEAIYSSIELKSFSKEKALDVINEVIVHNA